MRRCIALLTIVVVSAGGQTVVNQGAAARFLQQATWGPTPDSIAHVQAVGFEKFIEEQLAATPSKIPDVPANAKGQEPLGPMQQQFFVNAVDGNDQLRQRVAFALGEIWVVSGVKLHDASEMVPYLRLLHQDAFANYRQIINDVTLSPGMGHYLDMVNNDKPNSAKGTSANENYARELLQLFTIGLVELNSDGTAKLDVNGNSISTYDQETIEELARVFTGWTYAPKPGAAVKVHNPANWDAPMVAVEKNHDTLPKVLFNTANLPAGQTAETDLNQALDTIFSHDNVGPFVCRQLIQHLVESAPSPQYVERVAGVFADNGRGTRGDMAAVVKAILLDPEARSGDTFMSDTTLGHLQEPVLFINGLLRALQAKAAVPNALPQAGATMGQNVYLPDTVFNYFPPGYTIPGTNMNAPEFGILSPATEITRANFVNALLYRKIAGVTVDLSPWASLAGDPDRLLDAISNALYEGKMPANVRNAILPAVQAATTNLAKAQTAWYLAATCDQYQVQQ